jgi:hypothetical protein
MGIIASEKIFVDPKEEINFVLERANKSEKEKLIFVIPQNSIILSSPVSINILFKEISKSKKTALIVTEDGYGQMIAEKAGFVVAQKVSQVTAQNWDLALTNKLRYLDSQERKKKELLSNIGLIEQPIMEENKVTEDEVVEIVHKAPPIEIVQVEDTPIVEEPIEAEPEQVESEEVVGIFQKPRKESKVIELGALKIASGGDIRTFLNSSQGDKIQVDLNTNSNMTDIPDRKVRTVVGSTSFAGKDFTKHVQNEGTNGGFLSKLFGTKRTPEDGSPEALLKKKQKRKKLLIISSIVVLILLLGGGYLFAFQLSSVDLNLTFKKEDVSASADILLNPNATEVSYSPVVIPAKELRQEGLTISKSGEATGTAKKGVKATGFVTIYNITASKATLPVGTVLTNAASDLKYVTKKEVVIDAGNPGGAFIQDNVPVEAQEVGEEYNIKSGTESTRLKIAGYEEDYPKIYAGVFNEVTGGSSEEITTPSQDNYDKLKETLLTEIEAQGASKVRLLIPTGYTLVQESIKFTETKASALPAVGEKADDGKFTLSLEGYVTAYAVSNEDLKSVAAKVLSEGKSNNSDSAEEGDVVVDKIDLPQITKITEGDQGLTITIATQASVGVRPSDDVIKQAIAGKNFSEAQQYLDSVESIDTYRISFTPSFVPEALRIIPSDMTRITIKVK